MRNQSCRSAVIVTGLFLAEGRLRHSQTLASLGRMAGGIAHDFNNLLTVILGYSELLARRLNGSDLEIRAREVRQAAERGATLTTQLLAFSRKQHFDMKVIDLRSVVSGLRAMLQRLIGENVVLVTTFGSRPALLQADPHQIEQVIVNLVLNARDAMPDGGTVRIDVSVTETSSDEGNGEPTEQVRLTDCAGDPRGAFSAELCHEPEPGRVRLNVIASGGRTGMVELARLQFERVGRGDAQLTLTVPLFADPDGRTLPIVTEVSQ